MAAIHENMPRQQYDLASLTKKSDDANAGVMDAFHDGLVNAQTPPAATKGVA